MIAQQIKITAPTFLFKRRRIHHLYIGPAARAMGYSASIVVEEEESNIEAEDLPLDPSLPQGEKVFDEDLPLVLCPGRYTCGAGFTLEKDVEDE